MAEKQRRAIRGAFSNAKQNDESAYVENKRREKLTPKKSNKLTKKKKRSSAPSSVAIVRGSKTRASFGTMSTLLLSDWRQEQLRFDSEHQDELLRQSMRVNLAGTQYP